MDRTAVVYHYYEKDAVYRDNFVFFLTQGWLPHKDYFVIVAGEHSIELPQRPNIRYLFTPNLGHDFAGYCQLVESGALEGYGRLIFVNCTVRGPFLPPYAAAIPWTAPFLQLLEGDVHLCGATINILHDSRPAHAHFRARHPQAPTPFSHVQSSVHAMTAECLAFLRSERFYVQAAVHSKDDAVSDFEIAMSDTVRAHGWNIACLLPPYNALDYRRPHHDINPATKTGHPQTKGAYFGMTLHPYEVLFVKTGWNLLPPEGLAFHTLTALRHHPRRGLDWPEAEALAERQATVLGPPLASLPATATAPAVVAETSTIPGPTAPQDGRICLLVLGMHRSGTSALAGMLAQIGITPPATLMAPHASNPRGFFESVPVRDFNDALLSELGSMWNDWRPLSQGWTERAEVLAMQEPARQLVATEFGDARLFVLKDPRVCRLLPFWKSVFAAAGIELRAVLTHRHPSEVAASLANRYASVPATSRLLWLRHVLDAEFASRDLRRCFTSYERLLADPVAEARHIVRSLGLPTLAEAAAADFITTELHRHRMERDPEQGDPVDTTKGADATAGSACDLAPWHREALLVLEQQLDGSGHLRADQNDILNRIRAEFDRAAAAMAPIFDNDHAVAGKLRKAENELRSCRARTAELQSELAKLRAVP